jgi:DNA repair exonuclease SbcCD ATPase subunit
LTNEKFFSSVLAGPRRRDDLRAVRLISLSTNAYAFGNRRHFVLGGPPRRPQYGLCLLVRGIALDATPEGSRVMADESHEQSSRAVVLTLAALAAAGWLAAGFVWRQGGQTQSFLTEQLTSAERARESLASDLQNLEKTAGGAADLKKQAADAEKALSEASTARASAQNELADLTKQISDARLAISGAQEEASAKTRDLQAVDSRLKDENDRAATLQSQDQALSAELGRLQSDAEAARKALADAQTQTTSTQKEFEALQGQVNSATAELNALQAQIRTAKPETGSNPHP